MPGADRTQMSCLPGDEEKKTERPKYSGLRLLSIRWSVDQLVYMASTYLVYLCISSFGWMPGTKLPLASSSSSEAAGLGLLWRASSRELLYVQYVKCQVVSKFPFARFFKSKGPMSLIIFFGLPNES